MRPLILILFIVLVIAALAMYARMVLYARVRRNAERVQRLRQKRRRSAQELYAAGEIDLNELNERLKRQLERERT